MPILKRYGRDLLGAAGLALIGGGTAAFSPALAAILLGVVLVALYAVCEYLDARRPRR